MAGLSLTYSLADQDFAKTKSLGILNYSCGLGEALAQHPEVRRLCWIGNSTLPPLPVTAGRVEVVMDDRPIRSRWRRMLWDQWGVYRAARRAGTDWLFLPKGFAPLGRRAPLKLAAIVADTIQYHYRDKYPDHPASLETHYFLASFRATLKYCRVVFTISDFTKACVEQAARDEGIPVARVITCGIGFRDRPAAGGPRSGDLLVPASRFPHKLTAQAVAWLERWRRETSFGGRLQMVGALPDGLEKPESSAWCWHRRLPESEYQRLHGGAAAVVYFSEFEGFGMPPIEAVIAGSSAVYSGLPATREVMGDCGHAFDNADYSSFARALNDALGDRAEAIAAWRAQLLARHSWDLVVNRVVKALREA